MSCLYCGKEIGPIQLLRDSEFCCSTHRLLYRERLGKALDRIGEKPAEPCLMAGFAPDWPVQEGPKKAVEFPSLSRSNRSVFRENSPSISIISSRADTSVRGPRVRAGPPLAPVERLPRFALPLLEGIAAAADPVPPPADPRPLLPSSAAGKPTAAADPAACHTAPHPAGPAFACELRTPVLPGASHAVFSYVAPPKQTGPAPPQQAPSPWATPKTALPPLPARARPAVAAPRCASWMPPPAAQPAERLLQPLASAVVHIFPSDAQSPAVAALWAGRCEIQAIPSWQPVEAPEPVEMTVAPSPVGFIEAAAVDARRARVARLPGSPFDVKVPLHPTAGYAAVPIPAPVESMALAAASPHSLASKLQLHTPALAVPGTAKAPPDLARNALLALQAHEGGVSSRPVASGVLPTVTPTVPQSPAAVAPTGLPQPAVVPLEYYCARGLRPISRRLEWMPRSVPAVLPPFALRIAAERLEEIAVAEKKPRKSTFAEIFSPSGRGRRARAWVRDIGTTIAATLLVGSAVWYGLNILRHPPSVQRYASDSAPAESTASARHLESGKGGSASQPAQSPGLVTRIRHAVAERAASELSDSFHNMADWGASSGTWAQGWSRHPDGFVRPGQLALFHPSIAYTDYRLEFFGQIEHKAIDWAVRAQDPKNYYAMKFAVVEPGLRPMIAMVHYTVVGGKRSRRTAVPLNVMIHNNTPYHVAVEVRGNHIVTSIEGQEVDTWIEDTLPKGGVGFFAEAGERSRLYWMKVTRNEDFLGRICAMLAGDSADNTRAAADSWPASFAVLSLFGRGSSPLFNFSHHRRFPWNS